MTKNDWHGNFTSMEQDLKIRTPDDKIIYGTLLTPTGRPKGLVILIHGLGGISYWPPLLAASRFFRSKGFATFRFDLYSSWLKGARRFQQSSLLHHSRDLDTIVTYFKRRGHCNIFGVGHSFGGLTILRSNTSAFTAVSMWDLSSPKTYPIGKWLKYEPRIKKYIMRGNTDIIVSRNYLRDFELFPDELELASAIQCPTQICYADGSKGLLIKPSKAYFKSLTVPKELVAIKGASHCFLEEGKDLELFTSTARWFSKH